MVHKSHDDGRALAANTNRSLTNSHICTLDIQRRECCSHSLLYVAVTSMLKNVCVLMGFAGWLVEFRRCGVNSTDNSRTICTQKTYTHQHAHSHNRVYMKDRTLGWTFGLLHIIRMQIAIVANFRRCVGFLSVEWSPRLRDCRRMCHMWFTFDSIRTRARSECDGTQCVDQITDTDFLFIENQNRYSCLCVCVSKTMRQSHISSVATAKM